MSDVTETHAPIAFDPTNPLLSKLNKHLPPVIRKLPSQGILYVNEELDSSVQNGEIKIFPMTADDELEMKSPDLLFSGEALYNVISRRCPQIRKPEELFIKDADYIMLILRLSSYGSELEIPFKHDCDGAKEHKYVADLNDVVRDVKNIDASHVSEVYNLTLPSSQIVSFRPMRLKHMIKFLQASDADLTPTQQREYVYESLLTIIDNVDGTTHPEHIKQWLKSINPKWVHDIRNKIEEINDWGPIFTKNTKCKDCDEEVELPINTNPLVFFT